MFTPTNRTSPSAEKPSRKFTSPFTVNLSAESAFPPGLLNFPPPQFNCPPMFAANNLTLPSAEKPFRKFTLPFVVRPSAFNPSRQTGSFQVKRRHTRHMLHASQKRQNDNLLSTQRIGNARMHQIQISRKSTPPGNKLSGPRTRVFPIPAIGEKADDFPPDHIGTLAEFNSIFGSGSGEMLHSQLCKEFPFHQTTCEFFPPPDSSPSGA